ncbi:protease-4 [Chitinivorax tropicus]|uniref:Protease-4 n=1 Tax=Chitinivorax tropicus TaxID=714531 RepID=A0A840MMG4_9PROT|nr:S49 family peptidase [Chitinivorax tropicus]MBB5019828.1 protease-4 [Chitinivorax tropicus]
MAESGNNWERDTIEKLLLATVKEQRKARGWNILFRFMSFGMMFLVFAAVMGWFSRSKDAEGGGGPHTAVVEMFGEIAPGSRASADVVTEGLRNAFKDKNTKGVILRINSPGGSPVQAGQIYDEIRRLRAKYPTIPLYAVVDDICASGGYYAASAADKIYVDKASLIGSIGVLMNGFGFTGTMEKLGVERRLLTAGKNKGFMDPFSPMNEEQQTFVKEMLAQIHQQFIDTVRQGRGKRLKEDENTFSGLIWNGEQGIKMGLADGFGTTDSVARDVIKAENAVDFTPKENWADRFAKNIGTSVANHLPLSQTELQLR